MQDISNDEIVNSMLEHSIRLTNLKYGINFLQRCMEDNGYIESNSELCSIGNIIHEYCLNTKKQFNNILDNMNIEY
jgi:hypothetical protein